MRLPPPVIDEPSFQTVLEAIRIGLFFYDILVYSSDVTEHERHLGVVFNILKDNKLFANENKCVIRHSRIQYLGH